MLITVDLDDTLIHTHHLYGNAIEQLGEFIEEHHGVPAEHVQQRVNEIDTNNLSDHELSRERFPTSFRQTLEWFDPDAPDEHYQQVDKLGRQPFLTPEEYRDEGFIAGAYELVMELEEIADELHLITAGDERVQQKKIDALSLSNHFDGIHIVPVDGKQDKLEELLEQTQTSKNNAFHIGNSYTSDVQAALDTGINAVYIPYGEWRKPADQKQYDTRMHTFDNAVEFMDNMHTVFTK